MILQVLRALFVLLMAAVGWFVLTDPTQAFGRRTWLTMAVALIIAVLVVCIDILAPRRKLAVFSGTFLGLLVGVFVSYALSFVVTLMVDYVIAIINGRDPTMPVVVVDRSRTDIIQFINMMVGITVCYLTISFVLQTKDDFRFVIPYVEFSKQTKGARPILLDTSVLIDGRITDIVSTGILESQLIVPQFVIDELQTVADSGDKLKRNRGRRGLDVLQKLRDNERAEVQLYDSSAHERGENEANADVDHRLVHLAQVLDARVLTNDFNLNKVAQLRNVNVININDLAGALRPAVLPGERMQVRLIKPGADAGQGVGYLDDGTMVVVEQGRQYMNQDVEFTVTNAVQTKAGRMIFGRVGGAPGERDQRDQREPSGAGNGQRRGRGGGGGGGGGRHHPEREQPPAPAPAPAPDAARSQPGTPGQA